MSLHVGFMSLGMLWWCGTVQNLQQLIRSLDENVLGRRVTDARWG
jgi:hypothetical protein